MAREKWNSKFAFLFTTVGSAVGIGNVWRFPYLCYKNGGGAFLIPYFATLFLIVLPQLILHVAIGQFTSRTAMKAWNIVPIMRGMGIATTILGFMFSIPYATVLAWGLRYLYASFSSVLPWSTCGNSWNSPQCYTVDSSGNVMRNHSLISYSNESDFNISQSTSSVQEFWERGVLNISSGLTEVGSIQFESVICLVVVWIVCFLCMYKGVNWTSKIAYVTATLPIILLIAMLIRGLTLDGASDGISYFLSTKPEKLLQPQVWKDAVLQNMYSLGIAGAYLMAIGSFNHYHDDFVKDTIILSITNSGASLLSGFTVFSTLGFMAKQQNTTVEAVAESGPGLAFIAYPQAVAMMPFSQVWSVIFFLMFFLLGLDSLFVGVEASIAAVVDLYSNFFDTRRKHICLNLVVSVLFLLVDLPTVTQGGMYYIYLFENFVATSWGILFGVACECIAISWLYGNDKFYEEICIMLQYRPKFPWYKYSWKYVTPPLTMILFVYCLALNKPLIYNRTYVYPGWAIAVGWILTLSSFLWTPGYAIYYLIRKKLKKPSTEFHIVNTEEEKSSETKEF